MLRQTLAGRGAGWAAATVAAPLAASRRADVSRIEICMAMVLSEAGIARRHFSAV